MSKQTAVEWLEQKIEKLLPDFIIFWQEEFEHAKAMEREQIIQANRDGVDMVVGEKPFVTGDEYYNETYGGEQ